jgi:glutamate 5-kinase
MAIESTQILRSARRIVVKVGSSLVTNEGRGLDAQAIGEWARQLAVLVNGQAGSAREVIMVSSGAVAEGMKRLGWSVRPRQVHELQAAAAVGQMGLAQMYETKLRENGIGSAQVLLTHADLADRERYLNARSTLLTCCAWASCQSSTRTTPSSTTRSSLATTTPWERWLPTWWRPTCWSS